MSDWGMRFYPAFLDPMSAKSAPKIRRVNKTLGVNHNYFDTWLNCTTVTKITEKYFFIRFKIGLSLGFSL